MFKNINILQVVQVGLIAVLLIMFVIGKSPTVTVVPDYTKTLQNIEVVFTKKIDSLNIAVTHLNAIVETNKKKEITIIDNRKTIVNDKIKEIARIDSTVSFKQLDSDLIKIFGGR